MDNAFMFKPQCVIHISDCTSPRLILKRIFALVVLLVCLGHCHAALLCFKVTKQWLDIHFQSLM